MKTIPESVFTAPGCLAIFSWNSLPFPFSTSAAAVWRVRASSLTLGP
jgi:hypothetical protein